MATIGRFRGNEPAEPKNVAPPQVEDPAVRRGLPHSRTRWGVDGGDDGLAQLVDLPGPVRAHSRIAEHRRLVLDIARWGCRIPPTAGEVPMTAVKAAQLTTTATAATPQRCSIRFAIGTRFPATSTSVVSGDDSNQRQGCGTAASRARTCAIRCHRFSDVLDATWRADAARNAVGPCRDGIGRRSVPGR